MIGDNIMLVDRVVPFVGLTVRRSGILNRRQLKLWGRDKDVREVVAALLLEKYEAELGFIPNFEAGDEESGLMGLLDWLINNQDAIKALIEMIMSLFVTSTKNETLEGTNVNVL